MFGSNWAAPLPDGDMKVDQKHIGLKSDKKHKFYQN